MPQSSSLHNQWPTSSDYGWYTPGDYGRPTPGDYGWPTLGSSAWPIIARSVTLRGSRVLEQGEISLCFGERAFHGSVSSLRGGVLRGSESFAGSEAGGLTVIGADLAIFCDFNVSTRFRWVL